MDLHFYNWNLKDVHQDETVFDTDDAYRIMQGAMELEDVILEQSKLIQEGLEALPKPEGDLPAATPVCSLVIGEWGNWHGKAFINRPALFQQASMLDAITTALTLDIFHRNCDKVSMACIAQSINVLNSLILTKDDKMLLTPNYDVFEMYKVHRNAHIVELEVQSEEIEGTSLKNLYTLASAKDNKLFINLVHTNVDEPMQVNLGLDGNAYEFVSGKILASDDIHNHNTFENPNLVRAKAMENVSYDEAENCWKVVLPAASVCTLQFQKKS
jgi:alpha-N-arabinofuranosidase